jgi:hypothetical protein
MFDRRSLPMTRTVMHASRSSKILAGVALLAALGGGVAAAGVSGTVTEITKNDVTVNGAVYGIAAGTSLEDQNGRPIALPEIRPGTPVDLEFDDDGDLGVIRATVVR